MIKALNGADVNLFCCDAGLIQGRSVFFWSVSLVTFHKPKHLFKNKCAVEAAKSNRLSSLRIEIRLQKICS